MLPGFFTFMSGKAWHSRTTSIAGQAFVCIVSRRVSWKLTEAAMWNVRDIWLDIRSPWCSADNPSPALAISPSTYVTFMSLSFGTDANSCKGLNYLELSLSKGKVPNLNTSPSGHEETCDCCPMRCWRVTSFFVFLHGVLHVRFSASLAGLSLQLGAGCLGLKLQTNRPVITAYF